MKYCRHLEWREFLDGDFYVCSKGLESSSDWCEGESDGQCKEYDPITQP